jgi:hypothetical protein
MADTPKRSNHKHGNARQGAKMEHPVEVVVRRCKVCEWEGELIEPPGANPDCPWCHGPTERKATLAASTGVVPPDKNPHAAALGRLGGLKGGHARAQALTPTQRRRIASRAARARWQKKKDPTKT